MTAADDLEAVLARYRPELTGYCYRMLGSPFDADDAVQETYLRAWRGVDRFEGRASMRSWLYRIATNVCLDLLNGRNRRALPMELSEASPAHAVLAPALPESTWVRPIPDALILATGDPAEQAVTRETIRLAFIAALQHLPPRQRAVLILRDVLRWSAAEVADLLSIGVVAANGLVRRARATLAAIEPADPPLDTADDRLGALLARYVDAFERYDVPALVDLLREDARLAMPPNALWLRGATEIGRWWEREAACRGSRLVPVAANGCPAVAQYRAGGGGGGHVAFALHVLSVGEGGIVGVDCFVDPELFPLFGLPAVVDGDDAGESDQVEQLA